MKLLKNIGPLNCKLQEIKLEKMKLQQHKKLIKSGFDYFQFDF